MAATRLWFWKVKPTSNHKLLKNIHGLFLLIIVFITKLKSQQHVNKTEPKCEFQSQAKRKKLFQDRMEYDIIIIE